MGLIVGTRSGFSCGKFVATGIEAALARAVKNSGEHAFAKFGKKRSNIQLALDARFEYGRVLTGLAGCRILQIIKCAAVGECGRKRCELKWRDLNAFAEAGHARDATLVRRRHGKRARLLVGEVVTSKFAKAEQAAVL